MSELTEREKTLFREMFRYRLKGLRDWQKGYPPISDEYMGYQRMIKEIETIYTKLTGEERTP